MSAPPFPPQPAYPPAPPPLPSQASGSSYYNPYTLYPGFPPPAPQPYESYPLPKHEQNQPHHSHHNHNHNQGQGSSPQHMFPRPIYSLPAKLSNAIFVKNLPYNLSVDEFMSIYSKFGEIATKFTNKISTRGFAFVTYYDIRSAINAVEQMKDQKVYNRQPVTTFSFNPPEHSRLNAHETSTMVLVKVVESSINNATSTDNHTNGPLTSQTSDQQSSTFNSFFGSAQNLPINSDSVANALSPYGEIYKTVDLGNNQFVVQFYDFRNALNAIASSDKIIINNQKVILESYVEPDEGVYYENAPPGYNPQLQTQSIPPPSSGMPNYPPPYQAGNLPHQGNNSGGNRNNRNNRNNNHGNRYGNHPPHFSNNQPPFQPPPPPPSSYLPQQPQQLPPQIPSQQQQQQPPIAPSSIPPTYSIPPPPSQYQQNSPQMQYMMQYPQGIPPAPPPPSNQ